MLDALTRTEAGCMVGAFLAASAVAMLATAAARAWGRRGYIPDFETVKEATRVAVYARPRWRDDIDPDGPRMHADLVAVIRLRPGDRWPDIQAEPGGSVAHLD